MYRSKTLTFFMAIVLVLSLGVGANAETFNWQGADWSQSFRVAGLWNDSSGLPVASNSQLNSLMTNLSLGAEFNGGAQDMGIRGADAADGEIDGTHMAITISAPFYYSDDPNRSSHRGMSFKDQWKANNLYTFSEFYFRGTMDLEDCGGNVTVAGNMQVTGPAEFITNSLKNSNVSTVSAFIDASRVDTFGVRWYNKASTSEGNVHVTNANNAFFGTWQLTARLYADTAGALGDADVIVYGGGGVGNDANDSNKDDGKNQGILVLGATGAISPTAKLEVTHATVGALSGKVVLNANVSVRQLVVDGRNVVAGTYTVATDPNELPADHFEGTGSITVADVNATAIMTMACADTLGNAITGDTGQMPRIGTKGYKPGYAARIRAQHTMAISGAGYTFSKWKVNGADYSTAEDTTVTMDADKAVTAVYTKASGASNPIPANRAGAVSIATDISWTPDPAATVQQVYFGTSTAVYGTAATPIYTGNGSLSSLTNAQIIGVLGTSLRDNAIYYWQVRSDVSNDARPQWLFTTGNIKVTTPAPADIAADQAVDTTLTWTSPDAGATSFDVYFGTSRSDVENGVVTPVNVATASLAQTGLARGQWYYWRVDSKFASGKVGVGNVWSFRVSANKIYLNTNDLTALDESSAPITGVAAAFDDAGVAVFKFDNFNYGQQYDFVVSGSNKLAIWSDNSMSLGGVLSVSAPAFMGTTSGPAIAGGYIGGPPVRIVRHNGGTVDYPVYRWTPVKGGGTTIKTTDYHWMSGDMNYYRDSHAPDANYWPPMTDTVYGPGRPYAQFNYVTTTDGQYPKLQVNGQSGSGGSYGGAGGNSTGTIINPNGVWTILTPGSNATAYAQNTKYYTAAGDLPGLYGQKEIYELWGGSGGSGGFDGGLGTAISYKSLGGTGGGGVVEFYTKGNLTIGPNAQVLSNGGNVTSGYVYNGTRTTPELGKFGGAGSGGSIRLVAKGGITLSGKVAANGGNGANNPKSSDSSNTVGAGGGGGRIAIYKGGVLSAGGGVVTVSGGTSGTFTGMPSTPDIFGWQSGKSGSVYGMQSGEGTTSTITNAHYPIPADGTRGIAAGSVNLTWLPGVGSTTNVLYFGTSSTPALMTAVTDPAGKYLRARKSVAVPVSLNTKYYWRVECDGVMGPLWMFRTAGYEAKNPSPAQSATNVTTSGLNLTWQDGYPDPNYITSREVFFGTDQAAVAVATSTSPLKIATVTDKASLSVSRPSLLANTTYYWRVDTYASISPSYVDGLVWSFTTRAPVCLGVMAGDFNNDCKVSFADFAVLASGWGTCNLAAGCP